MNRTGSVVKKYVNAIGACLLDFQCQVVGGSIVDSGVITQTQAPVQFCFGTGNRNCAASLRFGKLSNNLSHRSGSRRYQDRFPLLRFANGSKRNPGRNPRHSKITQPRMWRSDFRIDTSQVICIEYRILLPSKIDGFHQITGLPVCVIRFDDFGYCATTHHLTDTDAFRVTLLGADSSAHIWIYGKVCRPRENLIFPRFRNCSLFQTPVVVHRHSFWM